MEQQFNIVKVKKHGRTHWVKYGIPHKSGKNHKERRAEAAEMRLKPERDRRFNIKDAAELSGIGRWTGMINRGRRSHARAEARKFRAAGKSLPLTKRVRAAMEARRKKLEQKKTRQAKYARKLERQK